MGESPILITSRKSSVSKESSKQQSPLSAKNSLICIWGNVINGINNISINTGIRGRWEILSENPKIICDVGHNINAFKQIVYHLKNLTYKKLRIVIGFVEDKDFKNILNILPKNASYYFCKPKINRGLDAFGLLKYGNKIGLKGKSFESVKIAYETCKFEAENEDLIFIGGSNFVVAELLWYCFMFILKTFYINEKFNYCRTPRQEFLLL